MIQSGIFLKRGLERFISAVFHRMWRFFCLFVSLFDLFFRKSPCNNPPGKFGSMQVPHWRCTPRAVTHGAAGPRSSTHGASRSGEHGLQSRSIPLTEHLTLWNTACRPRSLTHGASRAVAYGPQSPAIPRPARPCALTLAEVLARLGLGAAREAGRQRGADELAGHGGAGSGGSPAALPGPLRSPAPAPAALPDDATPAGQEAGREGGRVHLARPGCDAFSGRRRRAPRGGTSARRSGVCTRAASPDPT